MSENELNKIIANNISKQLELRNLTQQDLAEYMKVSQATVSNWCKGIKMPRMSKIDMICEFFSIQRSELLNESESTSSLVSKDARDIMAKNIRYYMDLYGKSRKDMCEALGVKYTTLTDWVNGNSYPRIDKIEMMANFFGIEKSDLVEDRSPSLSRRDTRDIEKILEQTREQLTSQEGLMFDGDPASPEAIDSILSAMQIGMEMAKKKNKEKYTPKKYKKD